MEFEPGARSRLLAMLRCPTCLASLAPEPERLICERGHLFEISPLGIPLLGPSDAPPDAKRDLEEEENAAAYAGLHAFAAEVLGRGEAEGLYRTVSDLALRAFPSGAPSAVLDIGCGPGRTLVDVASAFPQCLAVGLDRSVGALSLAYSVARLRGPAVTLDLRRWGFGLRTLAARDLANVVLAQGLADRLPFVNGDRTIGFDAVLCVNLLDRVEDPPAVVREIARVLRLGGRLILTTPLNWREPDGRHWAQTDGLAGLRSMLERAGLAVLTAFDGLVYREILDARGSVTDWRVTVVEACRPGHA